MDDAQFVAGQESDDKYLADLGYEPQLNRTLGMFSSAAVQFSAIGVISVTYVSLNVGLGYFGPASIWAWVIGGAFQVFLIGLAVAELVSAYPLAGGVYQINNRILAQARSRLLRTPWIGWQTGWAVVVAHTVSVAAVAYLMVPYVTSWFGIHHLSSSAELWWVLGLCSLSTLINIAGIRVSSLMNNLGVLAEVAAGALAIAGLLIAHHHTQPLAIFTNTAGTTHHGGLLKAFLFSCLLPLFLIQSFDSTGNASEETRDAARSAPAGVFLANSAAWLYGILFIGLLYLSIPNLGAVMVSATPAKLILDSAVGRGFADVIQAVAIMALMANMVVVQLTGARVAWALARDGEVPAARFFARVSKTKVPITATLFIFLAVIVVDIVAAHSASAFSVLVGLTALAWAAAYAVVVTTGLYGLLTHRLPQRPFTTGRFAPLVFGLAVVWAWLACAVLVWQNPGQVGGGMLGAIAVGSLIYVTIPRHQPAWLRAVLPGRSTVATHESEPADLPPSPFIDRT